jgi:basic membrane protein A and related proteins
MKKMSFVYTIIVFTAALLSACGSAASIQPTATSVPTKAPPTMIPATAVPPTPVPPTAIPPTPVPEFQIGLVTDMGGIDDKSFNSLAWKGIKDAMVQLGVGGMYLESNQQSDYAKNIQQLVDEDYDLIITSGFQLSVDTATIAKANPNQKFAIIDITYPDCWPGAVEGRDCGSATDIPNVRGQAFKTEQAAFLGGYLAAGMTKTGTVATFGGMKLPTVTIFMKGFQAGVKYYNEKHSATVQVLGWNDATKAGLFTGNFSSMDDGAALAKSLVQQNADIILPIAGVDSLGAASYCQTSGKCLIIGVDNDWYISNSQYSNIILSSLQKNVGVAVLNTIQDVVNGTFTGGTFYSTLNDGGVGLAPFHDFESQVPQALKDEIAQVKADLNSGAITIDGILSK